jgi:hypothetical protein
MSKITYLTRDQVPATLRGAYTGTRFAVQVAETVSVPIDAGLWDGGTRDHYQLVRLADGLTAATPGQDLFHDGRKSYAFTLEPGFALVRHSIFQGRDTGLMIWVRPDDVAPLLPSTDAPNLSREAHIVLACAGGLISSYRRAAADREGIDARTYDRMRQQLTDVGLMTSAGAITARGRNVLNALPQVAGL